LSHKNHNRTCITNLNQELDGGKKLEMQYTCSLQSAEDVWLSIETKQCPHFPLEPYQMELGEMIGEEKKIYNHHDNHNISIQAVATRVLKGEYQLLAHIQAPLEQY